MSIRLSIRPAGIEDLQEVGGLLRQCLPSKPNDSWRLEELLPDQSLLVGRVDGRIVTCNAVDVDTASMRLLAVLPAARRLGLGTRMLTAAERLAVQYGIFSLRVNSDAEALPFYRACGYTRQASSGRGVKAGTVPLKRRFTRRQTRFGRHVAAVTEALGIGADYGRKHRLRLQKECTGLTSIGADILGREQALSTVAARGWHEMRRAASDDGIILQVASAFRSVDYQQKIFAQKLTRGHALADILRVSAAPGYSEHHSGLALDITTPGTKPMETEFENTPAFEWLVENAHRHGFRMSFPRHNHHGIAYEPWHWCFRA